MIFTYKSNIKNMLSKIKMSKVIINLNMKNVYIYIIHLKTSARDGVFDPIAISLGDTYRIS